MTFALYNSAVSGPATLRVGGFSANSEISHIDVVNDGGFDAWAAIVPLAPDLNLLLVLNDQDSDVLDSTDLFLPDSLEGYEMRT